jgi:hypothetical protein
VRALQEEELRRNIRENEGLHRRRLEEARKFEHQIRELQQVVESTRAELAERQRVGSRKESETAGAVERFQLERVQLKQRVEDLTAELAHATTAADQSAAMARERAAADGAAIVTLQQLAASKSFFDDTTDPSYNALNVPPADGSVAGKANPTSAINDQALQGLREFVSAFSNLLTYLEERATHLSAGYPDRMAKTVQDYCSSLNNHSKYIKPLDRSFAMFHDGTATLGPFAGAFSNFDNYLRRLLPHVHQASACCHYCRVFRGGGAWGCYVLVRPFHWIALTSACSWFVSFWLVLAVPLQRSAFGCPELRASRKHSYLHHAERPTPTCLRGDGFGWDRSL